jgi:tetratricopeptide (TPR) repeat protein
MIRVLLAAMCMVLFATIVEASGLDHLKAAKAAAEGGNSEEAIHLFTQAITAGDLSPDDKFDAYMNRGSQYSGRSLVADYFQRRDDAHRLRDNAIADFTAALGIKADNAVVHIARGEVYDLNGQYDQAIADFDAALKVDKSPITLIQRAASQRAKGDYDRAVADYDAALAIDSKDSGLDGWEILNERAYAQFLAARFDAAAADFEQALTIGATKHTSDVRWFPYQAAWLHVARARGGHDDSAELAGNAGKMDVKQWPGTLIAFFLGQVKADELAAPSSHGPMAHGRECNVSFFVGEHALIKGDKSEAAQQFQKAREACNLHTLPYLAAGIELKGLGK